MVTTLNIPADTAEKSEKKPSVAASYFRAGLLGSALGYVGICILISISLAAEWGDPIKAVLKLVAGLFYAVIPAVFITFLLTAPLACIIGLALRRLFKPAAWHGAVTGVATVAVILVLLAWPSDLSLEETIDQGTILFSAGVLLVGAVSGWIAYRRCIGHERTRV